MNNTPPEVIERWRNEADQYIEGLAIGEFHEWTVDDVLRAFIASRDSVRIELPEKETQIMDQHSTGVNLGISECRMAIRQQGYKAN